MARYVIRRTTECGNEQKSPWGVYTGENLTYAVCSMERSGHRFSDSDSSYEIYDREELRGRIVKGSVIA